MRIERLTVSNFRNLAEIDLRLHPQSVIVGENQAGKSNLIHAIRLILDANLSFSDRQLTASDFWDGLTNEEEGDEEYDPMAVGAIIEASIEIANFEADETLRVVLSGALLQENPMRAKLTYRFAPVDTGEATLAGKPKYLGAVYGGHDLTKSIPAELRRYLHVVFLHALRDVESDIRSWKRSPLRALLEAAADAASDDELSDIRGAIKDANEKLNDLGVIKDLGESIGNRLLEMVGDDHAVDTELAVAPDDPMRLIRNMRIFTDGDAHRGLDRTSLGTLNVLYLALQELGLDARRLSEESDISHLVMAIEEPEAHLHPHLQRLIFRRLLREDSDHHTTLVTTQSPHVASVADPRTLIVLRTVQGRTSAAAAHSAELPEKDWDDISRYLDATRAELVFARRVLFVEGFAEQALIPKLAGSLGMNLDKLGISICAVHGTHFASYVKFCNALQIPRAVVTDGDKGQPNDGTTRASALLASLKLPGDAAANGIFVGSTTFEYDVLEADDANVQACYAALASLCAAPSANRIAGWGTTRVAYDDFMDMIKNAGGKGRYAQRLSTYEVTPPRYVAEALSYLAQL